jgi:hypothetical protein
VCETNWAATLVNPGAILTILHQVVVLAYGRYAASSAVTRSMLRQVITLADQAHALSDIEVLDQLIALAQEAMASWSGV